MAAHVWILLEVTAVIVKQDILATTVKQVIMIYLIENARNHRYFERVLENKDITEIFFAIELRTMLKAGCKLNK